MKKVLIAGSLNIDLVVRVPRFPQPGETLTGLDYRDHIGGKGANQASACALQNVPTIMWGFLGSDAYGDTIMDALASLDIQMELSRSQTHTGLALIEISPEGQNRIVVVPGANAHFTVEAASGGSSLIASCDILVLQHEIPLETCAHMAKTAKNLGKVVILNPAPAAPVDFLPYVDYIIPNEHELGIISKMPADTPAQIEAAMLSLKDKGAACVITTLGSKGLCYTEGQNIIYIAAPKLKVVDTTGAGDALVGALAAYLAKGLPLNQALHCAVHAASLSVTRFGAFASAGSEEEIKAFQLDKK